MKLVEDNLEMRWRGLEGLVDKGLVKEIGVSNFSAGQIAEILSFARIRPSVCECEAHPYFSNEGLVEYCKSEGIRFVAYAPLGTPGFKSRIATSGGGHVELMKEDVMVRIAKRVGKSTAQVLIKWAIQRGTMPIVKTTSLAHVKDNLDMEGWGLREDEMREINGLEKGGRVFTYAFAKHSKYWHYE